MFEYFCAEHAKIPIIINSDKKIMDAYIISIGEELLIGQTVNTNASWLASQLNLAGIAVNEILVIPDKEETIAEAIKNAGNKADIVLITGGLGPTKDDVTKNALCAIFETKLVLNQNVLEDIKTFFGRKNLKINELNEQQAMVPEAAEILPNPFGTAPGLWFNQKEKQYIAMPGVPYEMKEMVLNHVLPRLKDSNTRFHILHKTILTHGIGESFLAQKITSWEDSLPDFMNLAYLPSTGIVKLRLTAKGYNAEQLQSSINDAVEELKQIIQEYIWGYDDDTLENLAGKQLLERKQTLAAAESCTGGYLAHRITGVPGCSAYFLGSIIAYDNAMKEKQLGVDKQLIEKYGAVSEEVVAAMVRGTIESIGSDYALGVTGIAGPSGGTSEKPVGTTWIAAASRSRIISRQYSFGDNRERNIVRATNAALALLHELFREESPKNKV